ncbi:hypothetical protein [Vibrio bivalvicida]|uniref:hypothetical protein n=1 Tax=Vibrio bivalvicida TaxID=1276888 RepID=UPI000A5430D2|nr:hypothetical protein [Vibrio bivalvicida]
MYIPTFCFYYRHPQERGTKELGISYSKLKTLIDSLLAPSSLYGMTQYGVDHLNQDEVRSRFPKAQRSTGRSPFYHV